MSGDAEEARPGIDYPGVSCVFFCHDGTGRCVLQLRSRQARDEPGVWDSGAGKLDYGEDPVDAVVREVKEEYLATAYEIETLGVRNMLRNGPTGPTHWVALIHSVRVDPSEVGVGEPHKVDAVGWFRGDSLPTPLHSGLEEELDTYRRRGLL